MTVFLLLCLRRAAAPPRLFMFERVVVSIMRASRVMRCRSCPAWLLRKSWRGGLLICRTAATSRNVELFQNRVEPRIAQPEPFSQVWPRQTGQIEINDLGLFHCVASAEELLHAATHCGLSSRMCSQPLVRPQRRQPAIRKQNPGFELRTFAALT